MKTKFLLLLLFLCQAYCAFAQTTITLGTFTTTSASAGPVYVAVGTAPTYSRQLAIYTAAEINTAGVTSGVIQKIKWHKTDANGYNFNNGQIRIYVKHTTQNSFASSQLNWATEQAGATLVYSSNTQNLMAATGWQEFILTTPFVWNGTNNLEILVDWVQPSPAAIKVFWQYSPGMINMTGYGANSTPNPTIRVSGLRPNVQLEFGTNTFTDAGITSITSPVSPVLPGVNQPVQVIMRNFGGSNLTSATINWSVNGVLQTPFAWTGNVAPAQITVPVTIGTYTFPAGSHNLCAWTQSPNGLSDFNPHNDSTCVTLASCTPLAGNYTINSGATASATNFISFNAAAQRLNDCGISGPVKFTVAPGSGPYNEQFELRNIPGTPDSVVFDGNGATLAATLTTAKPAAILLNGTKRVKFRNLNVTTAGNVTGYAFQLLNGADFTGISDCQITMPIRNTISAPQHTGIMAGFSLSGTGNFTSNSVFRRSIITGGDAGIRIYGDTATLATQNQIIGNQIRDFLIQGVYLMNTSGTAMEQNDLSRPTLTRAVAVTVITLERGNRRATISRNRIHNTHGSASGSNNGTYAFGMEISQCKAPAGQENIVKNNLFYDFNTTGEKIALYTVNSEGLYFFHNSVDFNQPAPSSGSSRAIDIYAPVNVKVINNIVSLQVTGTHKNYLYNFGSQTPTGIEIKNNVLYMNASSQNFIGKAGNIEYPNLAAWQLAGNAGYDMGSQFTDPLFTNVPTGNLRPKAQSIKHTGLPLIFVPEDFDGIVRSVTNPDPGAYEFSINTGLRESSNSNFAVKTFPNPFKQELNLELNAAKPGDLQLTLFDALGRTVCHKTEKVAAGLQQLTQNFETALPAGLYLLQIELNGMKMQQKLVKVD
jgi:hypothetical protein